ncbi:GNAT family N-acetyltransferase [Streptomyces sp. RFCAC02]|uniref:GNAT family N-acetyltransferase n=1 Tax=Streptomyces sp. RFCAC02 TaxID=2499143 RepID=UPI001021F68D|nr:GNAT family N-acetyltransferase [Streptomyces sp. RFCAC02]
MTPPASPDLDGQGIPAVSLCELDLAEDATAAAVHRIGRRAYAVEAGLIGFDGIPALRESVAELRGRPLRWLGAMTDGGRIAAFVAWRSLDGGAVIDIDRVCVDPAWFRRGLASRLIGHLLADLAPRGDVRVSTGTDNHPAVALYQSLGFSRIGTGEPVPGLRMAHFALTRDRPRHPDRRAPRPGPPDGQ